jgi:hypothetical protein
MKFNRDIQRLLKTEVEYSRAIGKINQKVQEVCEFEIHLENVPGDGWCFGSEVSGFPLYMTMQDVLEVVEKTGRFTKEDWSPFN